MHNKGAWAYIYMNLYGAGTTKVTNIILLFVNYVVLVWNKDSLYYYFIIC